MNIARLPEGVFEYDVNRPLGQKGGFGQVFAGTDDKGQTVAVKRLLLSARDAAHRELRIAAELKGRSFEHVIPVIAAGEDTDTGDYFVVMACAGDSLEAYRRTSGPLGPHDVADILRQIVSGLIEAGDWVHRDIKPANVLRHQDKWKIADFGIARFYEEATAPDTLRQALSPHYASPEQWRLERATHASDAYALGCLAYFLVTGSPPFVKDPEREHRTAALPAFASGNARLDSLVHMLVRKPPEVRPSFARTRDLLDEALRVQGATATSSTASASLADVGAQLAAAAQQEDARAQEAERERQKRGRVAAAARDVLRDNLERLWGRIHLAAPTAVRQKSSAKDGLTVKLGASSLQAHTDSEFFTNMFGRVGWDIFLGGTLTIMQSQPAYRWSTSLWYGGRGGGDLRWFEIGYFAAFESADAPFGLPVEQAIETVGPGLTRFAVACGPWNIDDESEAAFHDRVLWLLARAATGQLRHPSHLPIGDWSAFAR